MNQKKSIKFIHTTLAFLLQIGSTKFNPHALKKYSDILFIILENILVHFDTLSSVYIRYYTDIIEQEIQLASITKKDKILHIGSGCIPATSLLLATTVGSPIVAIDKNQTTIKTFNKTNMAQIINAEHANAIDHNVHAYDVIIISQGIEPRDSILQHISKKINTETRVLFRTISDSNGSLSKQDQILQSLFTVEKIQPHPNHGLLVSVLLLKKHKQYNTQQKASYIQKRGEVS